MMNRSISHSHRGASTSVCCSSAFAATSSFRARSAPLTSRTIRFSTSPSLAPTPPRRSLVVVVAAAANSDDAPPAPPSSSSSSEDASEDVWATKPLWCRPYSIIGTGVFVVCGAKVVGGTWLALAAAAAISVWWWAFLVEYPVAYRDYVRGTKQQQAGAAAAAAAADSEEI